MVRLESGHHSTPSALLSIRIWFLKPSEPSPAFKELISKMGTQDKPQWKDTSTDISAYWVEPAVLSYISEQRLSGPVETVSHLLKEGK